MRRGFTLLEVLVALTIAGLIALTARATLNAGLDTQERVQLHVGRAEANLRFRNLLMQTLRHLTDAPVAEQPPVVLRDTLLAEGVTAQVLEFYSRGLSPSAGSGAILHVRLAPASEGLTMEARDSRGVLHMSAVDPNVRAMRVRLQTQMGAWVERWPRTLQAPASVAIELWSEHARQVPLVVATALEEQP